MTEEKGDLHGVLAHAERLAALLFVHELTPPIGNAAAALWLLGRAAEVERYVEWVAEDLASGSIDEPAAIASMRSYIDAIHVGLATTVGDVIPSCCQTQPQRRGGGRKGAVS